MYEYIKLLATEENLQDPSFVTDIVLYRVSDARWNARLTELANHPSRSIELADVLQRVLEDGHLPGLDADGIGEVRPGKKSGEWYFTAVFTVYDFDEAEFSSIEFDEAEDE